MALYGAMKICLQILFCLDAETCKGHKVGLVLRNTLIEFRASLLMRYTESSIRDFVKKSDGDAT
jgi:hypothetical protein